jgi:tetratricopeptide (TPR) repeat protein
VTLTALQCDLLTASLSPDGGLPGEDLYGLGRFLHQLGQQDRAEVAYTQAAETCRLPPVREQAMRDLAYLLKRQGRREEALPWWQRLVETGAVYASEELAKHYEWQEEDLPEALAWTGRGIALAGALPPGPIRRAALADLNHRLERLQRKMA